ncbi:MAG: hypothetical protein RLZ98_3342 [Pseudomonadota bacterium]|jgi:hypothetical protein
MGIKIEHHDKLSLDVLQAIDDVDDPRQALVALKARIKQFEESGKAVPEALVTAEYQLVRELAAQSQGR